MIKILNLNCFGSPLSFNRRIRFVQIAESILALSPDIVLLQEVIFSSDRKILIDILTPEGYHLFPQKNINFKNGGLLTLIKNIKVENFEFYKFREQGPITFLALTDRLLGKGAQLLKIRVGNKIIDLINTHLLCKYGGGQKANDAFLRQLDELTKFVKKNCTNPLILGGDLNVNPDSGEIKLLKDQLNLIDSLADSDFTVNPTNSNRGQLMNRFGDGNPFRTDYILLGKGVTTIRENVVFNELISMGKKQFHLSDHFGVFVEIKL